LAFEEKHWQAARFLPNGHQACQNQDLLNIGKDCALTRMAFGEICEHRLSLPESQAGTSRQAGSSFTFHPMATSLPTWLKRPCRWLPVLLPLAAHAQAPVNDEPRGAISLPLSAACTPTSATNAGATTTAAAILGEHSK
jgi:hypothetical protein